MTEGYLTTHVLDTARGQPARGMAITLYRLGSGGAELLVQTRTNDDGRADAPLLAGADFTIGRYELVFDLGAYLDALVAAGAAPRFLEMIPIRFGISDPTAHYHVPLLVSPYSYSTYRGS